MTLISGIMKLMVTLRIYILLLYNINFVIQ